MFKPAILFPALALLAICLHTSPAFADSVTLTSGSASTFVGVGTVNLSGDGFVLRYSGEIAPSATTSIPLNSVTHSIGLPSVTFGGVTTRFFGGSLGFNETFLTGGVTAYATMDDMFFGTNPLFSLSFQGTGFLTQTRVDGFLRTEFTVTQGPSSPVPEPASMFLLTAGLAGIAAHRRSRRKNNSSTQPEQLTTNDC